MSNQFKQLQNVGEVTLGETAYIRVTIVESADRRLFVGVRRWIASDTYKGPTKEGIIVRTDKLGELIALLQKAQNSLANQRWVDGSELNRFRPSPKLGLVSVEGPTFFVPEGN